VKSAYELAQGEIGTVEWRDGSNPKVVAYFKDAGHPEVKDDATAWCAAFVGAMLHRAGDNGTGALNARSYLKWGDGVNLTDAKPGDIVVFKRGNSTWEGHVAFFVSQDAKSIKVLGGNQSDAVNIKPYPKSALLGIRRADDPAPMSSPAAVHRAGTPVQPPKPAPAPAAPDDAGSLWARLLRALWGILMGRA